MSEYRGDAAGDANYTPCVGDDMITGRTCHGCGEKKAWEEFSDLPKNNYKKYLSVCSDCMLGLPENRIEGGKYILYLHPDKKNRAYRALEKYWNRGKCVKLNYGVDNDALRYPFHISLTSFFRTGDPETAVEKIKDVLKEVDPRKNIEGGFNFTSPCLTPGQEFRGEDQLHYRGVGIRSKNVHKFLAGLESALPFLEVKKGVHLTLYHNISTSNLKFYENMVSEILNFSAWGNTWSLALWKTNDELTHWEIVEEFD